MGFWDQIDIIKNKIAGFVLKWTNPHEWVIASINNIREMFSGETKDLKQLDDLAVRLRKMTVDIGSTKDDGKRMELERDRHALFVLFEEKYKKLMNDFHIMGALHSNFLKGMMQSELKDEKLEEAKRAMESKIRNEAKQ